MKIINYHIKGDKLDNPELAKALTRLPYLELIKTWAEWGVIGSLIIAAIADLIAQPLAEKVRVAQEMEIAAANAEAAKANERTETLRKDNLFLQKSMMPRRLGQLVAFGFDAPPQVVIQFAGIKKFAGTEVLIQVVPDFEAQNLANDMIRVLSAFGWKPRIINPNISHVPVMDIEPGVNVTWPDNTDLKNAADALADGFTKAGLTGFTASSAPNMHLLAQGFQNRPNAPHFLHPYFDPPVDAVIVMIGVKNVSAELEGRDKPKVILSTPKG